MFDLIPEVAARYRNRRNTLPLEIWTFNRQVQCLPAGGTVRVQAAVPFRLHWTCNEWEPTHDTASTPTGTGAEFADVPTASGQCAPVRFTFFWTKTGSWEGRDFKVGVSSPEQR